MSHQRAATCADAGQPGGEQHGRLAVELGVLGDDVGDGHGARVHHRVHPVADGRFSGEVGLEDEPERAVRIGHEGEVGTDRGVDPLLVVGGGRQRLPDGRLQVLDPCVEQGQVQLELAGEVLVEDGLADAGLRGDRVHRCRVVAGRHEHLAGGVQQLAPPLGATQPPPVR